MNRDSVLIPVDFDDLDEWLHSVGSDFSPAELHGALVGGLSGAMRLSLQEWSAFGAAIIGAADDQLNDTASKVLGGLAQEQLELLAGEDLDFVPFLPDDDCEIGERVAELGLWCKGFLGGFAEAQVQQAEGDTQQMQGMVDDLPPNVAEALQDMTAIAQVSYGDSPDVDVEDDDFDTPAADSLFESEPFGDEEYDERDYCELVEYLRLAALTVFTEYGWVEVQDAEQARKIRSALDNAISLEGPGQRTLH